MSQNIIGIAGTNGSGKDTVGHILASQHNYLFLSVTEILRMELRRQGQPVERENMRELSAAWRREYGYGVLIDRTFEEYEYQKQSQDFAGVAIASLRNPYEADRIHELGGVVWWLDADPRLRYDRIQANASSRGRSEEDTKTFEQFLAEEEAEMHASGDAATLDMAAVRDRSDLALLNAGSSIEALAEEIRQLLEKASSQSK